MVRAVPLSHAGRDVGPGVSSLLAGTGRALPTRPLVPVEQAGRVPTPVAGHTRGC